MKKLAAKENENDLIFKNLDDSQLIFSPKSKTLKNSKIKQKVIFHE
jgi:hypothetical protein